MNVRKGVRCLRRKTAGITVIERTLEEGTGDRRAVR